MSNVYQVGYEIKVTALDLNADGQSSGDGVDKDSLEYSINNSPSDKITDNTIKLPQGAGTYDLSISGKDVRVIKMSRHSNLH